MNRNGHPDLNHAIPMPRRSRNAASAGETAPTPQPCPRTYPPCGTPRSHADEIINARAAMEWQYHGHSPESDEPPSADPFLYMPRRSIWRRAMDAIERKMK